MATAIRFVVYGGRVVYGFFVWVRASRIERRPDRELEAASA